MALSEGQKQAYDAMISGQNVFLTGEAGTGKSYVIKEFIKHTNKRVLVCAPTGVSAINVGGLTLHRAFKLPIVGLRPNKHQRTTSMVSQAEVIVIDEISMCRMDVFHIVADVILSAKKAKQVVVVGDFFQLPPVLPQKEEVFFSELWNKCLALGYTKRDMKEPFAFMSFLWGNFNFTPFCLTEPMRQKEDIPFLNALNQIRSGNTSALQWIMENSAVRPAYGAIYLCGRNDTALQINNEKLAELDTPEKKYVASVTGDVKKNEMPVDSEIVLKKGCRIMTIVNDTANNKFVNGSLGWVKEIGNDYIIVDFDNGARDVYIGLHGWELMEPHIEQKDFTQYRTVVGTLKNGKFKLSSWQDVKEGDILPNITTLADGTELIRTITKKVFIEKPYGSVIQLPVKVAYAITIHKSQGQTYDSVILDPRCFGSGQLYVALSRVRRIKDLYLESPIYWHYLKTSEAVKDFYKKMQEKSDTLLSLPGYQVSKEELLEFEDWWKKLLDKRKKRIPEEK